MKLTIRRINAGGRLLDEATAQVAGVREAEKMVQLVFGMADPLERLEYALTEWHPELGREAVVQVGTKYMGKLIEKGKLCAI